MKSKLVAQGEKIETGEAVKKIIQPIPSNLSGQMFHGSEVLKMKYIFGFRGDMKNNLLHFCDDKNDHNSKVIFCAGHNIVIYNYDKENRDQNFIHGTEGTHGITCMALSPSKKFLAFAEEAEIGLITIYDLKSGEKGEKDSLKLKKKKTLLSKDISSSSYVALAFSTKDESKYLFSISGGVDSRLVMWEWDRGRIRDSISISSTDIDVKSIFAHPESQVIWVFGQGKKPIQLFEVNYERTEKPLTQRNDFVKEQRSFSNHIVAHCLISSEGSHIILATDKSELLYLKGDELKSKLPSSPLEEFEVTAIQPWAKGFIVSGNECNFALYEKTNGTKEPYVRINGLNIQNKAFIRNSITSFVVINDETIIFGLNNGSLQQVQIGDRANERNNIEESPLKFEYLVQNFHTSQITDIDVCTRKPIIATSSLDKTVRIWNYNEFTLENYKEFDQESYSISFHPSGFHIAVAFLEKIRMINILIDDMKTFREINIRGCKELSFSNGGHYLAVSTSPTIHIYSTYTGEQLINYVFRGGHSTGVEIKRIQWLHDDLGLITCGSDGNVFEWKLENPLDKVTLFSQRHTISSIAYTTNEKMEKIMYANSDEKCLYAIRNIKYEARDKDSLGDVKKIVVDAAKQIPFDFVCSEILLLNSNNFIIMAANDPSKGGVIRLYKHPLTGEMAEFQPHHKGVLRLALSYDDKYLFSISKDNAIIVYEITDKDSRIKDAISIGEEYLYDKDKYLKKLEKINELEKEKKKRNYEIAKKTKIEFTKRNEEMEALRRQLKIQSDKDKRNMDELNEEKHSIEENYEKERIKLEENHQKCMLRLQEEHNRKMAIEKNKFEKRKVTKESEEEDYKKNMKAYVDMHVKVKDEKKEEYEKQLENARKKRAEIQGEKERLQEIFKKKRNEIEETTEKKIEKLRIENDAEITKLENTKKNEDYTQGNLRNKYKSVENTLKAEETRLNSINREIMDLKKQIANADTEKLNCENEITVRKQTIEKKDERINELNRKTEELEKFKFVLDYKIKELKRDIGPTEENIARMKEILANMKAEVEHFQRTNAHLKLYVNDFNMKLEGMKTEIKKQREKYLENDQYLMSIQNDLQKCLININDKKMLKKSLVDVYNKYLQKKKKKTEVNVDKQKAFIEQRAYLEACVANLKDEFKKKRGVHKQDNKKIMKENVHLINEINELIRNLKDLKTLKEKEEFVEENKKENLSRLDTQLAKLKEKLKNASYEYAGLSKEFKQLEKEKYAKKANNSESLDESGLQAIQSNTYQYSA